MSKTNCVVIDYGTSVCRAGIGGEDFPQCCLIPHRRKQQNNDQQNQVESQRRTFSLSQQIQHGLINIWDDFEITIHNAYSGLNVETEKYSTLLADSPLNIKSNREKIVQIMFETFNTPLFQLSISAILSLHASGRTTGIVIDSGENATYFVPIYEGYQLQSGILKFEIAGKSCTNYLANTLKQFKSSYSSDLQSEIIRTIKETRCYLSFNASIQGKQLLNNSLENNAIYQLPDGDTIILGQERFQCPEILFHPQSFCQFNNGQHQLCLSSIDKCDGDIQKELFQNIILAGGTTLFPGIQDRLNQEISQLTQVKFKLVMPVERRLSAWIGGSILSMISQKHFWITSSEYDDYGPQIVHRKCF